MRGFSTIRSLPAVVLLAVVAACGGGGPKDYGTLAGARARVAIPDLLSSPELYLGQEVAIEGRVFQVCQEMGCWFEVADSGRTIMVDLQMGRRFTIPERSAGMAARVQGKFVREEGVLKLIGAGVRLSPGRSG